MLKPISPKLSVRNSFGRNANPAKCHGKSTKEALGDVRALSVFGPAILGCGQGLSIPAHAGGLANISLPVMGMDDAASHRGQLRRLRVDLSKADLYAMAQPHQRAAPKVWGLVPFSSAFCAFGADKSERTKCSLPVETTGVLQMGPRGGVVTQRSAKPCTPVQFWSWPPLQTSDLSAQFDFGASSADAARAPSAEMPRRLPTGFARGLLETPIQARWHRARICEVMHSHHPSAGAPVGDIIRFVPKSELERARLIREARAIYDSIFPPAAPDRPPQDGEDRVKT